MALYNMSTHRVTLHNATFTEAWNLNLSRRSAARLDNGRMVSCGLMLGEDVKPSTLKTWLKKGIAKPADPEKAKHSGCQSRCILRGDSLCQW